MTVRNGRVNLTNVLTTAGTEVPVMCNVGYELTGGTTLLCQENGTWSNTVTCEIIGMYHFGKIGRHKRAEK